MMTERFDPKRIARQVGRSVRSWGHFVAGLPGQLQAILDQIKTGKVGVDFRVHAVDRLVDGLVTAAAVMARALLISTRVSPVVGSFSVPGLVVADVGVLTLQRLVARRQMQRSWVSRLRRTTEVARH
jgi:hypothetical protein